MRVPLSLSLRGSASSYICHSACMCGRQKREMLLAAFSRGSHRGNNKFGSSWGGTCVVYRGNWDMLAHTHNVGRILSLHLTRTTSCLYIGAGSRNVRQEVAKSLAETWADWPETEQLFRHRQYIQQRVRPPTPKTRRRRRGVRRLVGAIFALGHV